MMKSFKYRLYPNKEQEQLLRDILAKMCDLFNAALAERKDEYRRTSIVSTFREKDEDKPQPEKREHLPLPKKQTVDYRPARAKDGSLIYVYKNGKWGRNHLAQFHDIPDVREMGLGYEELPAHLLQDPIVRVERAIQGFYARLKAGRKAGLPRFRGKGRYDSFTFPDHSGWKLNGNRLALKLMKSKQVSSIKIRLDRPYPGMPEKDATHVKRSDLPHPIPEGKIKNCTIKREGDEWYVMLACEVKEEALPEVSGQVGIDLGVTHFAALSDGSFIEPPQFFRRVEKKLVKQQQAVKLKKKKSQRWKKAMRQVGKLHRKVSRQRHHFLHTQSHRLVKNNQLIVFEDLQTSNLTKRPKPKEGENGDYLPNGAAAKGGLNKSILDAGWATFVEYTTYKAEYAGRVVLKVNPQYTSQTCPQCGSIKKKSLDERWHSCECGAEMDRDTAAAKIILSQGQKTFLASSAPSGGQPLRNLL